MKGPKTQKGKVQRSKKRREPMNRDRKRKRDRIFRDLREDVGAMGKRKQETRVERALRMKKRERK